MTIIGQKTLGHALVAMYRSNNEHVSFGREELTIKDTHVNDYLGTDS